ncbi:MAG: glutamate--tRNA ligase [bacterium]|nr:glutamate--tRNA ligase [bacterium]
MPKELPPLPQAEKGKVRLRFEPNPDGPLHLGSARIVVLVDEYAKRYEGRFILRYADTNPRKVIPEAYDWIREDLEWLGVKVHEVYYQSDRLEIYYSVVRQLIEKGYAYVAERITEEQLIYYRKLGQSIPDAELPKNVHLERFDKMLEGHYKEGEAVVILKMDPAHPNPALRERVILRVIDAEHPRVGSKYHAWPTMNLSVAVDDYMMGITHVIRGKEHLLNTEFQRFIYKYMGWQTPVYIHIGRLHIKGVRMSKSKIVEAWKRGEIQGLDDPRTGTLKALRRRGILPEAIREFILSLGLKEADVVMAWDNLFGINRKLIDPQAYRRFFVREPVLLRVKGAPKELQEVELKNHPHRQELGTRKIPLSWEGDELLFYVERQDMQQHSPGDLFRLKDLCNVKLVEVGKEVIAEFHSLEYQVAKQLKLPKYHWVPAKRCIRVQVLMPDASLLEGVGEPSIEDLNIGQVVQFERFGFARLEEKQPGLARFIFTHD